ncbi:hypothetical protein CP967_31875 [Streptomyces nitrosporeus]|uniref:Protein kinase domain-containing protein n=1 Tax=Streptomyces nitrosporeus TaxID=28894 RepID=A0A5J6FHW9_9ACTN|nr:protein kinase [Streptomyces nitrosporeus]QEU75958.1 hypothetical protein CP967_31875 [Streptomyces nitrosporeus]GGY89759.1 hypothetical protein GCM10010327_20750 [Streptomyces nitrosporeus]
MKPLNATDPQRIGPYALAGRLGSGGMGEVYLGRSAGGRTVAVKVVRPDLAQDPPFRERFKREVVAARRVSGAFTAPVVDADVDAEIPWMATAFVVGLSLQSVVAAHGPLPEDTLRMLTAGLAEALLSVHGAKVIHRDLKPANVLLALDGPHMIDFGIARATDGTALTSTGAVIGSAPYMSPEQAVGQHLSAASDVFSLGSTIAFAAGGAGPFGDGVAAAVLFRVVHTEPDLSYVPPRLRPLIERCLAKDPSARPTPRDVIAYAERSERPDGGGAGVRPTTGWLPGPVAADVLALRAVLTSLPEPAPTIPLPDGADAPAGRAPDGTTEVLPHTPAEPLPGGTGGADGPGRRRLLLGLAGGALAAATGGGVWALIRKDSDKDPSGGASGKGSGSTPRPDGKEVPEAGLAWQLDLPAACGQVLSANGVVACVSLSQVFGVDGGGERIWTVEAQDHDLAFASTGTMPRVVAGVDGGRLHVGGTAVPTLSGTEVRDGGAAVLGVRMSDGGQPAVAALTETGSLGVASFCGVRDGRAHLFTMAGQDGKGGGVWALDLASRRTAWFHPGETETLFSAVPRPGESMLYSGRSRVVGLDGEGKTVWKKEITATLAAAGRYAFLHGTGGDLTAVEPGTGREAWKTEGAVGASARGGGVASDTGGAVVFVLLRDGDDGFALAALDSATGEAKWRKPVPAGAAKAGARLLHSDGNVYLMGADCVVWALDASKGAFRWKYSGWKGKDPMDLAWDAGDGRLCLSAPRTRTVATLYANGA